MSTPKLKATNSVPASGKAPPKLKGKLFKPINKAVSESKVTSSGKGSSTKKRGGHSDSGAKKLSYSKKNIRAFLGLTPQEKKRKVSISKKIRGLLKQRRQANLVDSVDSNDENDNRVIQPKRYKRPVEKLLKRLKTERRDEIPSDVNVHRHRFRHSSFIGAPKVREEVELIHKTLVSHDRPVQPNVGWEYTKKQRRLLQGFRHRKLRNAWHYFGGLKETCPARVKPNSHIPDALFFIFNLMIFLSTGVTFGFSYASDGFIRILEDSYEYELYRKNKPNLEHQGHYFWIKTAPFDNWITYYYVYIFFILAAQVLGFIGIYLADQKLHLAYVIGMVISLIMEGVIATSVTNFDSCTSVQTVLKRILDSLVENYDEKITAKDIDGKDILDLSGKMIQIKTYKAANLMDRIKRSLHCCGVHSINDYTSKNLKVPPSCCTPFWNLNPHCTNVIPTDKLEYRAKLPIAEGVDLGCLDVLTTMCLNLHRMMGTSSNYLLAVQFVLFLMTLVPLIIQARQIRQLRRPPHLRISAGSISQSLQASPGNEGAKTGGGGVRALVEASKFTEKQQERLQQTRREALFKNVEPEEESSESSEQSSGELPIHTVNFGQLKNLQQFVETEDKTKLEMLELDKTVEGFAGRFNILAARNLQNYASAIFSTTYQNETNAGLEAIPQTLERQFAQHTTDYNWRKLLTKPKEKAAPVTVAKVPSRKHPVHSEQEPDDSDDDDSEAS